MNRANSTWLSHYMTSCVCSRSGSILLIIMVTLSLSCLAVADVVTTSAGKVVTSLYTAKAVAPVLDELLKNELARGDGEVRRYLAMVTTQGEWGSPSAACAVVERNSGDVPETVFLHVREAYGSELPVTSRVVLTTYEASNVWAFLERFNWSQLEDVVTSVADAPLITLAVCEKDENPRTLCATLGDVTGTETAETRAAMVCMYMEQLARVTNSLSRSTGVPTIAASYVMPFLNIQVPLPAEVAVAVWQVVEQMSRDESSEKLYLKTADSTLGQADTPLIIQNGNHQLSVCFIRPSWLIMPLAGRAAECPEWLCSTIASNRISTELAYLQSYRDRIPAATYAAAVRWMFAAFLETLPPEEYFGMQPLKDEEIPGWLEKIRPKIRWVDGRFRYMEDQPDASAEDE